MADTPHNTLINPDAMRPAQPARLRDIALLTVVRLIVGTVLGVIAFAVARTLLKICRGDHIGDNHLRLLALRLSVAREPSRLGELSSPLLEDPTQGTSGCRRQRYWIDSTRIRRGGFTPRDWHQYRAVAIA